MARDHKQSTIMKTAGSIDFVRILFSQALAQRNYMTYKICLVRSAINVFVRNTIYEFVVPLSGQVGYIYFIQSDTFYSVPPSVENISLNTLLMQCRLSRLRKMAPPFLSR